MQIANYEIKPVSIYLPDTQDWRTRDAEGRAYFESQGITDTLWIAGIHVSSGIAGRHIYLLDNRASQQWYIGDGKVACYMSWYLIYSVLNALPDTHFMLLETDCRFEDGWKEKLATELKNVPEDFDFLFVGSCCAMDKQPEHIKGDVYEFKYRGESQWDWYPQCGHCLIVAKKAIPKVIERCRDLANPWDVALIRYVFPDSKIYAILPRLAHQGKTELPL